MEVKHLKEFLTEEKSLAGVLQEYSQHVHTLNHLWWYDEHGNRLNLNFGERMMLIVSELAEAMEGYRKDLSDDHLPQYKSIHVELADSCIRMFDCIGAYNWALSYEAVPTIYDLEEEKNVAARLFILVDLVSQIAVEQDDGNHSNVIGELAYAFLTLADTIATETGCQDFPGIIYDKLVYNRTRADHQYAARKLAGGKKF